MKLRRIPRVLFVLPLSAWLMSGCRASEAPPERKEQKESSYGGKTAPEWARQFAGADVEQRLAAADALVHLGPTIALNAPDVADMVTRALTGALKDEELNVRLRAAAALTRIGKDSRAAALATLSQALQDADSGVRTQAAKTLVSCILDETASPPLLAALKDKEAFVRREVARGFYWSVAHRVRAQAKDAVPALLESFKDKDAGVRVWVAQSLGAIGTEAARLAVIEAAKTEADSEVRASAVGALLPFGSEAKDVVPTLLQALKDGDVGVRALTAETLGQLRPLAKEAVPALIEALHDKEANVRRPAAIALGQFGSQAKASVPALNEALRQDPAEFVRRAAAEALKNIDPDAARTAGVK